MPALFVFLLKVNLALLLFCAGYYLVLRHLTFYTLNRIYLVTAILFASVYPQINLTGFAQRHRQMAKPVQSIIYHWQAPAEKLIEPLTKPDYWQWAEVIFWAGAALLAIRLLTQLYSLIKLYRNSKAAKLYNHKVRLIKGDGGPFSFWRSIYVNPDRHDPEELKAILLHEQVHVNEWHTLDILLAEFSTIFYWFNPGIWLMKKAIRENVEFITDRKILNKGIDSRQYQYSLVNVSFAASPNTIVNHFNISTIKKRIIMMNAKRSSGIKLTRYAFLIPAVVALLLVFSISKAELVTKSNKALTALKLTISKNNLFTTANSIVKATNEVKNIKLKKNDTIRNSGIFISTSGHGDSISYFINGIRATKSKFKELDPDHIFSIEILPADEANSVTGEDNNKNDVLFVTTDNSEAGKKFMEKVAARTHNNGESGNSFSTATVPAALTFTTHPSDSDTGKVTVISSRIDFDKDGATTKLKKRKVDTLIINNHYKNLSIIKLGTKNALTIAPDSMGTVGRAKVAVVTYGKAKYSYPLTTSVQGFSTGSSANAPKAITINTSSFGTETNMNQFGAESAKKDPLSKVLIIVDSKEVTEKDAIDIFKAGAFNTMTVYGPDDKDMIKQYGDKAKKGVVVVSTKKSN